MVNYLTVVEYLKNQDFDQVVKAIISYESNIQDEREINTIYEKFMDDKTILTFLNPILVDNLITKF
ncbi:hypothetical protein AZ894_03945 [Staphylococcus epidermidis]|uniref:hypothetical protein n=1 Tax=Staphylococcus epidermidis TaxID=1282 RepID=UPI000F889A22|nr:hypothetical protein [Staphylococcus epidermidis]RUN59144.1 hypothetical protein AZ894_03945 [Staphylococcus epidermidis]RUN59206.1 hypothetical protein AZ893_01705 [Staphylococcus epidermidis]RUN64140.1 hypothetical protein AZ897_04240 [Staphylococcus epidermidis]RUN67286.1 hypothetical protein AZ900_00255 [Staphylococcus epidermidis]RUN68295.1 hypothetical protein AZ899_01620 [Staphylococcus epidermidis]